LVCVRPLVCMTPVIRLTSEGGRSDQYLLKRRERLFYRLLPTGFSY
jgi:hypothetical protein